MKLRIERIIVREGDPNYQPCYRYCSNSRSVGNSADYKMRQIIIENSKLIAKHVHQLELDTGSEVKNVDYSQIPGLKPIPSEKDLYQAVSADCPSYYYISTALAQNTVFQVHEDFNSYFAAKREWHDHKEEFSGKPGLPGYKKHLRTAVFSTNGFSLKDGLLTLAGSKETGWKPLRVRCFTGKQMSNVPAKDVPVVTEVRITPLGNSFQVDIVYDVERLDFYVDNRRRARLHLKPRKVPKRLLADRGIAKKKKRKKNKQESKHVIIPLNRNRDKICAVDLGVDNFAAAVSIEAGFPAILIKGGAIKSINRKWNRNTALLKSLGKDAHTGASLSGRHRRCRDFMHKASRHLVDWCVEHDITVIVIGHNPLWKKKCRLGKRNTQNFVQIPYDIFVRMVKYKAAEVGIRVDRQEESYTSKASPLDGDYIPTYGIDDDKAVFSGSRTKRGLYQTKDNILINADINGALGIALKYAVSHNKAIRWNFIQKILQTNGGRLNRPVAVRYSELNAKKVSQSGAHSQSLKAGNSAP